MPRESVSFTIPKSATRIASVLGRILVAVAIAFSTYQAYDYYTFRRLPVWEVIDADLFFRKPEIAKRWQDFQAKQAEQTAAADAANTAKPVLKTTPTTIPVKKP